MKNIFSEIKIGQYKEEKLDFPLSAFEAFKRLYTSFKTVFLLESLGKQGKYNRFSYVGFDPLFVIFAKGKNLFIDKKRIRSVNPYKLLSSFSGFKSSKKGYCGGLVGFFGYEATQYFEKAFVGLKNREFPDFMFGFYLDGLKFDKKTRQCTYFYHGKSRFQKIRKIINTNGKLDKFSYKKLSKGKSKKEHTKMVLKAKKDIVAGKIYQSVLSLKSYYLLNGDKRRIYASLRQINPSPYMFYFKFGEREIISASPELLIQVRGRNIEHFATLAGTIKRGRNKTEDEKLKKQLQNDEKERAEHMMLVDLARNDMGRICEFGSIKVGNIASIESFSHVHHLFTQVKGQLRKKENVFSALSSCFPAGTLTGAPKIEAMKLIASLENESRGPYGGVGGYFSLNRQAMLAITIRSIFINRSHAYTQTGGGIVYDSIPEKEYQEIADKQKAIEETLKKASITNGFKKRRKK